MIESSSGGESDISTEVAGDKDHRFAMKHLSSYVKGEKTTQWLQKDLEEEGVEEITRWVGQLRTAGSVV